MIEFHAGTGPDSQAAGIALEEGFFDYRIIGNGPSPAIVDGGRRIEGAHMILTHLSQRAGWPVPAGAAQWLAWTGDPEELDRRLDGASYILDTFSIADMAVWPHVLLDRTTLAAHPNIARWSDRMSLRPAASRGLGAISADPAAAGR